MKIAGKSMKKIIITTSVILLVLVAGGCSKNIKAISNENIKNMNKSQLTNQNISVFSGDVSNMNSFRFGKFGNTL